MGTMCYQVSWDAAIWENSYLLLRESLGSLRCGSGGIKCYRRSCANIECVLHVSAAWWYNSLSNDSYPLGAASIEKVCQFNFAVQDKSTKTTKIMN